MFKRIAWLCAVAMLLPGIVLAGDEKGSKKSSGPKLEFDSQVPITIKGRDGMHLPNEHAHPLEGLYFPPESHHYQDLDTPPNQQLNRNVRILRTTNKAQLNRYVPVVYDFKNVNPFAVLRWVRRTVQLEEGGVFTFIGPGGNNGRMLVAVPEYQVPYITDLVKTIDRANLNSSDGTKRVYTQLKHRRANVSDDPLLDDSSFLNALSVYLTDNGASVIVDPEQNALFIQDAPSGTDYLLAALESSLDKPTPQAVLTTKIYEIATGNNIRLGTDYIAWKNGPGANLFAYGAFNEHGRSELRDGNTALMDNSNGIGIIPSRNGVPRGSLKGDFQSNGFNFAYKYEVNSAFFDFLATKGKARILNSAKVAAVNSRSASISANDQVLHYLVQTTDPSSLRAANAPFDANNGRTVVGTTQTVNEDGDLVPVEVGLSFDLTPTIYDNGLDVAVAGELSDYNGFDDTGFPRLNSRKFNTSIRMNVGEETILGGLMREDSAKAGNKVPLLGKIPVIGYLFGGENHKKSKREVVVAISCDQIVRYDGQGYGITADDKGVIDQGEGTKAIQEPATTWGFDMIGIDKEK